MFPADRPDVDQLALPLEIEVGRWPSLFRGILLSGTSAVLILVGLLAVSPLKELSVAEGQVIPEGQVLQVQHLEGGIVGELMAKPGHIVEAGQPLIRMDPTAARAELGQLSSRRKSLLAARIRLQALLDGTTPDFTEAGPADDPAVAESRSNFERERESAVQTIALYQTRVAQRSAEAAAAEAELLTLGNQESANVERVDLRGRLFKEGYASRNAFLDARIQLDQVRGRAAQVRGQAEAARSAVLEAKSQLADQQATRRLQWSTELSKTIAELGETEQLMARSRDRVERLYVRAPQRGVVQSMGPKSKGDVLKPGDVAAELVPVGDQLVAEVRLDPQDVGYVRPGLQARIKLTAFDPEAFKPVSGTVKEVSATTFKTEKGQPFYRVLIALDQSTIERGAETHEVLPGMVVRAEIVTGEKSVLRYLLKPIYRSVELAFTER
jgi:HlyD family secretion protein/adhesin transport system membrane fusion protein